MSDKKKKLNIKQLFEICMQKGTKKSIKATDVSTYCKSPFQLYCNHFVDSSNKDIEPDLYLEKLADTGIKHEKNIADEQFPDAVAVEFTTPENGFKMVIDDMIKGISSFIGAPLFYLPDGMYGNVDQLVRVNGKSIFGPYHYVIKEIKIARNIKKEHILQAAFYNHIIGKIQGHTPDIFYIFNMDEKEIPFSYIDYKEELFQTMQKVKDVFNGMIPTPTFNSCNYPWNDYCNKMALETNDISLINGLGLEKKKIIVEYGIKNLNDMLNFGESKLLKIPGIGNITAQKYIMAAKSLTTNKIIRNSKRIILPIKNTEIFLDLEGLDEITMENIDSIQTDYLIGVLVRNGKNEQYIPFVAHGHDKEEVMLKEFLDFIKKQKDYVIYHWHHYEKTHLTKMMDRYGITKEDKELVLSSDILFDLHPITTKQFVFPIPSTSIKAIAKYLGFSWKHPDVGAMNSIELYLSYINDSNQDNLNLVLDYNKDDCNATKIIKDWLVKQNE